MLNYRVICIVRSSLGQIKNYFGVKVRIFRTCSGDDSATLANQKPELILWSHGKVKPKTLIMEKIRKRK
jgi:hypothetical protein